MKTSSKLLLIAPALGVLSLSASAGSHTWDFTEIFSNRDGSIQFIELRECCGGNFETGLPGHTLSSTGNSWVIPGPALTPPTGLKHFLIATQGFADLPGAPTPDRIIPAGSVPFFSTAGDTLNYVPWDTWVHGAVPTDGVNSLKRTGVVSANNPTNYAGATGSVVAPTTFCDASDGAHASCPCAPGNPDSGCDIAQLTGGVHLGVVLQQTTPQNRVTVTGTGYPPASTPASVVIRASTLDPLSPVVFGDGLRCIGTPLVRLAGVLAVAGTSTHDFGHAAMVGPGTFYYQLWFRNLPVMYCDALAGFNLSNGHTIIW